MSDKMYWRLVCKQGVRPTLGLFATAAYAWEFATTCIGGNPLDYEVTEIKHETEKPEQRVEASPPQNKNSEKIENHSGKKYLRTIVSPVDGGTIVADLYAFLDAYKVTCPARQHAIKKLVCAGICGKADAVQDLVESRDAVSRAIQMEESRSKAESAP